MTGYEISQIQQLAAYDRLIAHEIWVSTNPDYEPDQQAAARVNALRYRAKRAAEVAYWQVMSEEMAQ